MKVTFTNETLFESSMSRLYQHLKTDYIGCITSFVTSSNADRTDRPIIQSRKANKRSNKQLSRRLQQLGFGFFRVDGAYQEQRDKNDPGSIEVAKEETYFVVCPKSINFENFTNTMIDLAREFEQESVIVWDTQKGYLFGTEDFRRYEKWLTFTSFSIDKARDAAWTEYKRHWFAFNESDNVESYTVESCTEITDPAYGAGAMTLMRHVRDSLFEKYDGELNHTDFDSFLHGVSEDMNLLEASLNRIRQHLETDNIATITSYITGDDSRRIVQKKRMSGNANRAQLKKLASDLKNLRYSFIRVDGEYKQAGQDEPVDEVSFFVICPEGVALETFTKDMINLAKRYEQESVIVWDYSEKVATLYGTDDFKTYHVWTRFRNFKLNDATAEVWTRFKGHWFTFTDSENESYQPISVSETDIDYSNPVHPYRLSHYRKEMFGKWY